VTVKQKNLEFYEKLPQQTILARWDDGDGPYYVARVAEFPHCLIHDDSPKGAIKEIQEVTREWIKSCLDRGE
jgi:predicted RNase H-like HicB family nuclease